SDSFRDLLTHSAPGLPALEVKEKGQVHFGTVGPFGFTSTMFASPSPALAIPAIQTSRAPIHDHQRLGAALVAHGGAGREAGAVAGDFDVVFVVGGRRDGAVPSPAFPRWGGGRSSGYVRVFF